MGYFGLTQIEPTKPMGGGEWVLPAGAYVCRIDWPSLGRTSTQKEMLSLEWSVAEGERAGFGANSAYPPKENIVLDVDNPKSMGYAAWKLNRITESNPGMQVTVTNYDGSQVTVPFDAVALVDNKQTDLLKGALVGFLIGVEDYTKSKGEHAGEDGERNFVAEWLTPQEVRQGFTVDKDGVRHEIVPPARRDKRKAKEPPMVAQQGGAVPVDPALQQYVDRTVVPARVPMQGYGAQQQQFADADIPF